MISFKINCADFTLSACTGLSGMPYAMRHFKAANETKTNVWEHRLIGFLEAFPILGFLVAVIEVVVSSCLLSKARADVPSNTPHTFSPAKIPPIGQASLVQDPLLSRTLSSTLAPLDIASLEEHLKKTGVTLIEGPKASSVESTVDFD